MRGRLLQSGWVGAVWIACLLGGFVGAARADVALIDASHLRYHIDTNETAAGGDSASGAATEADYTVPVHLEETQAGGTSSAMPTDTFDGYSLLALSFAAAVPTEIASKKDAAFFFYNIVGSDSTLDSAYDRQVIVPKQVLTSVPNRSRCSAWCSCRRTTSSSVGSTSCTIPGRRRSRFTSASPTTWAPTTRQSSRHRPTATTRSVSTTPGSRRCRIIRARRRPTRASVTCCRVRVRCARRCPWSASTPTLRSGGTTSA